MNYEKPSLFVILRQLVPRRRLQRHEAQRIAELQANRFRELQAVEDDELPEEAIATLPRVILTHEPNLPVSGLAQWHNGCWIIALNDREPWTRQRFSLAHELFHIINHTTKDWLHPGDHWASSEERAEQLADYFAGCLLMPKRLMKRYVGQGEKPAQLAERFGVSEPAIAVRLAQLGLSPRVPRCLPSPNSLRRVVKPSVEREGVAA